MGRYVSQARENGHEEMIQYYAEYGYPGSALSQADWYWRQLCELKARASRSVRHRDDVAILQSVMDRAVKWMNKAAERDRAARSNATCYEFYVPNVDSVGKRNNLT